MAPWRKLLKPPLSVESIALETLKSISCADNEGMMEESDQLYEWLLSNKGSGCSVFGRKLQKNFWDRARVSDWGS